MITIDLDELIFGYVGFVLPLFLWKTPHNATTIAFYLLAWTASLYIWGKWFKQ